MAFVLDPQQFSGCAKPVAVIASLRCSIAPSRDSAGLERVMGIEPT
jgi:hypothetical protein